MQASYIEEFLREDLRKRRDSMHKVVIILQ